MDSKERLKVAEQLWEEATTQAERHNAGKPRLSLVPVEAYTAMASVLEFGARKYAPNQWRQGLPYTETLDSLLRHVNAFLAGEDIDPESNCPHLAHAMCNAAFLITFEQMGLGLEFDDRWKPIKSDT